MGLLRTHTSNLLQTLSASRKFLHTKARGSGCKWRGPLRRPAGPGSAASPYNLISKPTSVGLMRVTRNSPHSTLTHMITSSSQLPSSASRISDALRRRVAIRVHNFGRENLSNPTDKCEISGISNKKIPKKYFGRILLETISKTSYIPILCIIIKKYVNISYLAH
jgi:hypothetical protein